MSLAQVVYNISNDSDFAAKWRNNPEAALASKGFRLSREEVAFLSSGLRKNGQEENQVRLSEIVLAATSWR